MTVTDTLRKEIKAKLNGTSIWEFERNVKVAKGALDRFVFDGTDSLGRTFFFGVFFSMVRNSSFK